jgi:ABC-type sugar transport system ATPase subunit
VLLAAVRRRADAGQTVMMVSHRMPEVLSVCDDFTVFPDGRTVATLVGQRPTEQQLVAHMTGSAMATTGTGSIVPGAVSGPSDPSGADTPDTAAPASAEDVVLSVRDVHGGPLRGVHLEVRRGEIVGIAGLVAAVAAPFFEPSSASTARCPARSRCGTRRARCTPPATSPSGRVPASV